MKTLYDLLGARPDDDAARLKDAFRRAVKANHPDLRVDDADAATRLRQIVNAYAILRHAEQRADYDQLLKLERERRRWNAKRIVINLMRNIATDAIAVAALTILLAGGYALFSHVSKIPVQAVEAIGLDEREPVETATLQPAVPTDTSEGSEPRSKLEHVEVADAAMAPSAAVSPNGGPAEEGRDSAAPSSSEPSAEITAIINALVATMDKADPEATGDQSDPKVSSDEVDTKVAADQTETKTTADRAAANVAADEAETKIAADQTDTTTPTDHAKITAELAEKGSESEPLDKNKQRLVADPSLDKDRSAPKLSSLSEPSTVDEKHSSKSQVTKTSDIKISGKPRMVAKRPATSHTAFKQAALENKNTSACAESRSCSGHMPPLFGVGF